MSSGLPDTELISRVLKGDQQAYAGLVDRYQHFVFTLALKYTGTREDAEEVSQDVFIKAYRSLADFRGGSKFSTWLYTITYNTSVTWLRKRRVETVPMDEERTFARVEGQVSSLRADKVEEKSRHEMVNRAIQMLSADDANLLTLFYKGEQSLEEIGLILGLEPNNVKVKLHRARQRLKDKMETHFAEEVRTLQD
jgi:RNA polymerase sigma-70 factor (ECF subfamily)